MQIGAHGLALAQHSVGKPIERREAFVTLDDELHAVCLEKFDDVAAVVERHSVSGEEDRTGQPFDERSKMFIAGVDEDLHGL